MQPSDDGGITLHADGGVTVHRRPGETQEEVSERAVAILRRAAEGR
jgi:hypothetical protein